MILDLHCHTKFSPDSWSEPQALIRRAKELGIDGIGLTEHYSYRASEGVEKLAEKEEFLVLRGVEVSTDRGHLLVYGVKNDKWNCWSQDHYLRVEEVIARINDMGGIAIPAHPYRGMEFTSFGDAIFHLEGITAVETHNGNNSWDEDALAQRAAKIMKLPTIGGSDCHEKRNLGRCITEFQNSINTIDDLIKEIREGRCWGKYFNSYR
jgi:hypothetical protein